MRKRTRSREFALQILYQLDINHLDISDVLEDFWKDRSDLALSDKEKEAIAKTTALGRQKPPSLL